MVSSVSGMSGDNSYTPQVNTAPAFSTMEMIEDESIFGKKGGAGGYVGDLSIFTSNSSECYTSDSGSSFADNSGIEM